MHISFLRSGAVRCVLAQQAATAQRSIVGLAADHVHSARRAVEIVCSEGPGRVLELAELGADFTRRADGQLSLHREGGHSHRRIVHAADVTGREIERALLEAASANCNIEFFEHHSALDLVMSEVSQPPCHVVLPAISH